MVLKIKNFWIEFKESKVWLPWSRTIFAEKDCHESFNNNGVNWHEPEKKVFLVNYYKQSKKYMPDFPEVLVFSLG